MENKINIRDVVSAPLSRKAEKILSLNLQNNEDILLKLMGAFGQALVITNKRVYILKWGFMTGNFLRNRCYSFEYRNITGININQNLFTGSLQILTASSPPSHAGYWSKGQEVPNAITFAKLELPIIKEANDLIKKLISSHQQKTNQ